MIVTIHVEVTEVVVVQETTTLETIARVTVVHLDVVMEAVVVPQTPTVSSHFVISRGLSLKMISIRSSPALFPQILKWMNAIAQEASDQ